LQVLLFLLKNDMIWLVNKENYEEHVVKSKNRFFSLWQGSKRSGHGGEKIILA